MNIYMYCCRFNTAVSEAKSDYQFLKSKIHNELPERRQNQTEATCYKCQLDQSSNADQPTSEGRQLPMNSQITEQKKNFKGYYEKYYRIQSATA